MGPWLHRPHPSAPDTFGARGNLAVGDATYEIYRINALADRFDVARLPYSIKVVLENLLRHEDGLAVRPADIEAVAGWGDHPERHGLGGEDAAEIALTPERVLMQDFTGVPGVVDLAAMRDALAESGRRPGQGQPAGAGGAGHRPLGDRRGVRAARRLRRERRHRVPAQHRALPAAALGPAGLRRVPGGPPGNRHLPPGQPRVPVAGGLRHRRRAGPTATPWWAPTPTPPWSTGSGVLGWGVGGIEAEAAMLGQPLSMLLPPVVGFRLTGEQPAGTTATDLVLTITHLLRQHGVVGKFVEFFGPGVAAVPLANRATIGNMSPEYGATCAIFPIDEVTLDYLRFTGRDDAPRGPGRGLRQGAGHVPRAGGTEPVFSETIELDLSTVVPSIAGPSRPQDLVTLAGAGSLLPHRPRA